MQKLNFLIETLTIRNNFFHLLLVHHRSQKVSRHLFEQLNHFELMFQPKQLNDSNNLFQNNNQTFYMINLHKR